MEKSFESLYVVCPFYRHETQTKIMCEELIEGANSSETPFSSSADKREYKRQFCEDVGKWKNCPLAQALNAKYE